MLDILGATFEKEGLSKPLCKRGGRKVQEKQKSVEKPEQEPTTEEEKKRRDNWYNINNFNIQKMKTDISLIHHTDYLQKWSDRPIHIHGGFYGLPFTKEYYALLSVFDGLRRSLESFKLLIVLSK